MSLTLVTYRCVSLTLVPYHIDTHRYDARLSMFIRPFILADPTAEKSARGLFLSTIERMLNARTVVIADGMNYIKGYRYQLFLHVRSQNTTHCVVHCAAPVEVARAWNEARAETERYDARVYAYVCSCVVCLYLSFVLTRLPRI